MSAAELKELRKETKKYIDHADERVVRLVCAMLEADAENENASYQLTPEQEKMLEDRMKKAKKGLTKFSTWEEVEKRITSRAKNNEDQDADWWDDMPQNIKADVKESLAQAARGEVMTHEQVKKKHPQWFSK